MKWRLYPATEGLALNAGWWDAANRATFRSHPLLDTRFLLPLVRYFEEKDTKLAILEDHELGGGLLVNARSRGIWSTFLPRQAQIAPVVLPPSHAGSLHELMRQLPTSCWLLEVLNQDPEYSCFRDRIPETADRFFHARTMRVDLSSGFDSYWRSRPKSLRRHVRRYLNGIRELDRPTSLRLVDSPNEIIAALKRYGDLEVRGWKGAAGTAVHADNVQGRFYSEVLENFARSGRAYVYELYFGEQLAASRLCIASDEMLVILKTTYDEDLSRHAPGRLLLYRLMESEFALGRHRVIEFYTNAKKETLAWGSESRDVFHVNLFKNRLIRRGFAAYRKSRQTLETVSKLPSPRSSAASERERIDEDAIAAHRVELVSSRAAFDRLADEWNAVCDSDGYHSLFLTHGWFDNFIREILEDRGFAIYLVRAENGGTVKAIFPMMGAHRRISWIRFRELTFLSNFYSPVGKPLYGTRKRRERLILARTFVRYLRGQKKRWATANFNMLPRETSDFDILQDALDCEGLRYTTYFGSANWILPTAGQTAAEYSTQLPSMVKNTIRRRLRRARRDGEVELKVFTDATDVVEHMDDYNTVYARSWKRPEPYVDFHRRLVEKLAPENKVAVGVAYFDGRPVAAQIWLFHENIASIVKLCYDTQFKEYSFGTILTNYLMGYAIDCKRVARVDYLTGDETYKRDWMSVRRERWGIIAFNEHTAPGRVAAFSEVFLKPQLKRLIETWRD